MILAVAMTLCGCGRLGFDSLNPETEPDAGSGGGDDAIAPPPFMGPAAVQLLNPQGIPSDEPVFFHDADGSLLSVEQTDGTGIASRDIPADAMITVIGQANWTLGGGGPSGMLFTFMGVQPGDNLRIGTDQAPWAAFADIEIDLPGDYPGAAFYVIPTGCGSYAKAEPGMVSKFLLYNACFVDTAQVDLVALAFDGNDNLVAFSRLDSVTPVNGDVTYLAFQTWDSNVVDIPMNLANGAPTAGYADLVVNSMVDRVPYLTQFASTNLFGGGTLGVRLPGDTDIGIEYLLQVYHDESFVQSAPPTKLGGVPPTTWSSFMHRRQSVAPAAIAHDLTAELLPGVSTVGFDTSGGVERPRISFASGDESALDGGVALVTWSNPLDGSYFQWWILFPPGTTELQLPELPDTFAGYRPSSEHEFDIPYLLVFDVDHVTGYDDMRNTYGFDLVLDSYAISELDDWSIRASTGPGGFPIYFDYGE